MKSTHHSLNTFNESVKESSTNQNQVPQLSGFPQETPTSFRLAWPYWPGPGRGWYATSYALCLGERQNLLSGLQLCHKYHATHSRKVLIPWKYPTWAILQCQVCCLEFQGGWRLVELDLKLCLKSSCTWRDISTLFQLTHLPLLPIKTTCLTTFHSSKCCTTLFEMFVISW